MNAQITLSAFVVTLVCLALGCVGDYQRGPVYTVRYARIDPPSGATLEVVGASVAAAAANLGWQIESEKTGVIVAALAKDGRHVRVQIRFDLHVFSVDQLEIHGFEWICPAFRGNCEVA